MINSGTIYNIDTTIQCRNMRKSKGSDIGDVALGRNPPCWYEDFVNCIVYI